MNTPSIKTLIPVFGDNAKQAKIILKMPRAELRLLHAAKQYLAACFNPPRTYALRLHCLDALGALYGVEAVETESTGEYAEYLNTGDTYAATVIYWRGKYRVQSLGDFVENNRVKFR